MKGPDGEAKYPSITKLVKVVLTIGHGSADIQRGFSESKKQLWPEQSHMEERLLNAKLWIKDGMKKFEGHCWFICQENYWTPVHGLTVNM